MAKHARSDAWGDQRQEDCHWWPTTDAMGATIWHVECLGSNMLEGQQKIARMLTVDTDAGYCPWCGCCWVDNGAPLEGGEQ